MMQRFWEFVFGLPKGFLSREGKLGVEFNPRWPGQAFLDQMFQQPGWGATLWNLCLVAVAVLLVIYVYRRETRSRAARLSLGTLRLLLLGFLIALLNRPIINLVQVRTEPSVLAVLIDDSLSMTIKDGSESDSAATTQPAAGAPTGPVMTRLEAAVALLDGQQQKLLRDLSREHTLRIYRIDSSAHELATLLQQDPDEKAPATQPVDKVRDALERMQANAQSTQVVASLRQVLDELQGQRLAGVVLLTDGRSTPSETIADAAASVRPFGVSVYPVALGSARPRMNLWLEKLEVQPDLFKDDIANPVATINASGIEPGHSVKLVLKNEKTGEVLMGPDNRPAEKTITMDGNGPMQVELPFKPQVEGDMDLAVEIVKQQDELEDRDNQLIVPVSVLDATVRLLYVDGYPRWDYRYVAREMIRDKTVNVSCLLLSADRGFIQEHTDRARIKKAEELRYFPYKEFPNSLEELMESDVVIFGDVEPRQFTDRQLLLLREFVAKKGGGFGMVAGPLWSPGAWRDTALEAMLPVDISQLETANADPITQGFRPVVTSEGEKTSIFRFFMDKKANEDFLRDQLPLLYWYCRGIKAKEGTLTLATHPLADDKGVKPPLLVTGKFGAGRTLFSAIDDSWRWRLYTGEQNFDNYWVQQVRLLARERKLGQRKYTIAAERSIYEHGEQVRVNLRILDPAILQQLPEQISVDIKDAKGALVRRATFGRVPGEDPYYVASWPADAPGHFVVGAVSLAGGVTTREVPFDVAEPRRELAQPEVNRALLSQLADATNGQLVSYSQAAGLAKLIPSKAQALEIPSSEPLWDAPLAMALFVLLITAEWVLRKIFGML